MTAVEVLLDCPRCRVESAVVAVLDTDATEPLEQRCRLCGWPAAARDLGTEDAARAALAAFARAEGEPEVDRFCAQSVGLPVDEVVRRLVAGEAVPTNFDAVAWLFGGGGRPGVEETRVGEGHADGPPPRPPPVEPPVTPRLAPRALASVMVADGEIRPAERRFVDAWLAARGLPPVLPGELRVWRAHELGLPPTELRNDLLLACVELVHLDEEPDDAEWRVVQSYARAWGVEDSWLLARAAEADARYAGVRARVWRRLAALVRIR